MVSLLALTFKGLTLREVCDIAQVGRGSLLVFLSIFKTFCFNFKSFWKISNINVLKFCEEELLSDAERKKELHRRVVERLRSEKLSLRKLEEVAIHLFLGEEYFALKQMLCLIENFLLLNNENTKMLLHEFWRKLEQKGYDLVQEYNKSLEIFDIRFMPSDKDIFLINIQLCQFFKGGLTRVLRGGRGHHAPVQAPRHPGQDRNGSPDQSAADASSRRGLGEHCRRKPNGGDGLGQKARDALGTRVQPGCLTRC